VQNDLLYVGQSRLVCLFWLGSLSGVRFSSGITPKCVCCGVKNRVPASIRCMIQFAPLFQFAQQMDADADADAKRMIYKRRWSKQGGVKQRKCSKTITRRRLRRDQEDSTTMSSRQRSLDKGTWKRQMLEPHEKQSVRLGQC
jgi:hypothetical protein